MNDTKVAWPEVAVVIDKSIRESETNRLVHRVAPLVDFS